MYIFRGNELFCVCIYFEGMNFGKFRGFGAPSESFAREILWVRHTISSMRVLLLDLQEIHKSFLMKFLMPLIHENFLP